MAIPNYITTAALAICRTAPNDPIPATIHLGDAPHWLVTLADTTKLSPEKCHLIEIIHPDLPVKFTGWYFPSHPPVPPVPCLDMTPLERAIKRHHETWENAYLRLEDPPTSAQLATFGEATENYQNARHVYEVLKRPYAEPDCPHRQSWIRKWIMAQKEFDNKIQLDKDNFPIGVHVECPRCGSHLFRLTVELENLASSLENSIQALQLRKSQAHLVISDDELAERFGTADHSFGGTKVTFRRVP